MARIEDISESDFIKKCRNLNGEYFFDFDGSRGVYRPNPSPIDRREMARFIQEKKDIVLEKPPNGFPSDLPGSYFFIVDRKAFKGDLPHREMVRDFLFPWEGNSPSTGQRVNGIYDKLKIDDGQVLRVIKNLHFKDRSIKRRIAFLIDKDGVPISDIFFHYINDKTQIPQSPVPRKTGCKQLEKKVTMNGKAVVKEGEVVLALDGDHEEFIRKCQHNGDEYIFEVNGIRGFYKKGQKGVLRNEAIEMIQRSELENKDLPTILPCHRPGSYYFLVDPSAFDFTDDRYRAGHDWLWPYEDRPSKIFTSWRKDECDGITTRTAIRRHRLFPQLYRKMTFIIDHRGNPISSILYQYTIRGDHGKSFSSPKENEDEELEDHLQNMNITQSAPPRQKLTARMTTGPRTPYRDFMKRLATSEKKPTPIPRTSVQTIPAHAKTSNQKNSFKDSEFAKKCKSVDGQHCFEEDGIPGIYRQSTGGIGRDAACDLLTNHRAEWVSKKLPRGLPARVPGSYIFLVDLSLFDEENLSSGVCHDWLYPWEQNIPKRTGYQKIKRANGQVLRLIRTPRHHSEEGLGRSIAYLLGNNGRPTSCVLFQYVVKEKEDEEEEPVVSNYSDEEAFMKSCKQHEKGLLFDVDGIRGIYQENEEPIGKEEALDYIRNRADILNRRLLKGLPCTKQGFYNILVAHSAFNFEKEAHAYTRDWLWPWDQVNLGFSSRYARTSINNEEYLRCGTSRHRLFPWLNRKMWFISKENGLPISPVLYQYHIVSNEVDETLNESQLTTNSASAAVESPYPRRSRAQTNYAEPEDDDNVSIWQEMTKESVARVARLPLAATPAGRPRIDQTTARNEQAPVAMMPIEEETNDQDDSIMENDQAVVNHTVPTSDPRGISTDKQGDSSIRKRKKALCFRRKNPAQRCPKERHPVQDLAEEMENALIESKRELIRTHAADAEKFRFLADRCVEIASLKEQFMDAMKQMGEKYDGRLTNIMKTVEKGPRMAPVGSPAVNNGNVLRDVGNQSLKRPRT